jgi:hypothetical protein
VKTHDSLVICTFICICVMLIKMGFKPPQYDSDGGMNELVSVSQHCQLACGVEPLVVITKRKQACRLMWLLSVRIP